MAKVIGFGGVFLKSKEPAKLSEWYKNYLGIDMLEWNGAIFNTTELNGGHNVFALHEKTTDYFAPSSNNFMINFVVDDLHALVLSLQQAKQDISEVLSSEFGLFAWIIDIEGNKVELWQPTSN